MKKLMKTFYFIFLFILSEIAISQETILKAPSEITMEFIKDFKVWNDFAYNLCKVKNEANSGIIENEYKKIIHKYCLPNKVHEPISFGSHSNHCPERESIFKESIKKDTAIIKTRFRDKDFDFLNNDYEFHFVKNDNKWYLEEIYLVDKDGKYEGL